MALTRIDHTGDGTTTQYDITFDLGYLRKEFVYVYLASDDYTTQLSYSWINSTRIQLDTPVENGVPFRIRRVIPRNEPVNDYQEGAILREDNLDDSFVQTLMILQEIQDGYIESLGKFIVSADIDLSNNIIKNCVSVTGLEETTENSAAVPFVQVLRLISDATVTGTSVVPIREPRQVASVGQTTFTTPANAYTPPLTLFVTADGVKQAPDYDYTVDVNGNVVFNEAVPVNTDVDILWYQPVITQTSAGLGFTTTTSIGDGVAVQFPLQADASLVEDDHIVSIDGVIQEPINDFTVDTSILTFDTAPPVGSRVVIRSVRLTE